MNESMNELYRERESDMFEAEALSSVAWTFRNVVNSSLLLAEKNVRNNKKASSTENYFLAKYIFYPWHN